MDKRWIKRRKRVFEILEIGSDLDIPSRAYDYINAADIIINLIVSIMYTFADIRERYGFWLLLVEKVTVVFFCYRLYFENMDSKIFIPGVKGAPCNQKIHFLIHRNCGADVLFAVFSAGFLPFGYSRIPNDQDCQDISTFPDQCLL